MPLKSNSKSFPAPIRERFNPKLIPALYNNFRNPLEALLELVDNAVDDRIVGQPLVIEITYRRGIFTITNTGGHGMGLSGLEEFLDWGGSSKRGKLGRYGQGGKAALGYLGRSWEIWCKREGEREASRIVEEDWHDRRMGLKSYTPERFETDKTQGIVSLRIWNMNRKLNCHQLAGKLGDLYKPFVITRQVVFRINGHEIRPTPIPIAAHSVVPIFLPVMSTFGCPLGCAEVPTVRSRCCPRCGVAFVITGWAGMLEPNTGIRGGLRCFSFGRMITAHDYFGHPDALQRHAMSLLYGEVLFDFVPMILNKTDYQREGIAWTAAHDAIHLRIEPLVKLILSREAVDDVPTVELEQAEQASRLIQRALRSVGAAPQARLVWPSDQAPTKVIKPPQSLKLAAKGKGRSPADQVSPLPRSPGGGELQIELKSLEPTLRAALVDRGHHKVMVINRNFPAYKLAGGSLAYLLETACLEWVKREGTRGESAIELIDRAVRLLGESSSIALTRRRRSAAMTKLHLTGSPEGILER